MKKALFTAVQVRSILALLCLNITAFASTNPYAPGIERTGEYYNLVHDKHIAVVANATSLMLNGTHTVDQMISLGSYVDFVMAPEHGFRGDADAGEKVEDGVDAKTGIPIRSLYGKNKRPNPEWFKFLDLVVFDIQDVGVRFYTYSTTLSYVLDACIEAGVPVLILDRGNPNGHYIDGPVLKPGYESMVGLHPIPVVHGLTMGEYATMVLGEQWVPMAKHDSLVNRFTAAGGLKVVKAQGYSHAQVFSAFQVAPSPNLRSIEAIRYYPSLCFFEGTVVSCGRGTLAPFTHFGAPDLPAENYTHTFTPQPDHGSKYPKFQGKMCHGLLLSEVEVPVDELTSINWTYFFNAAKDYTGDKPFFNAFLAKLAGTDQLRKAVEEGWTIDQWKESYRSDLEQYKVLYEKYLLYAL